MHAKKRGGLIHCWRSCPVHEPSQGKLAPAGTALSSAALHTPYGAKVPITTALHTSCPATRPDVTPTLVQNNRCTSIATKSCLSRVLRQEPLQQTSILQRTAQVAPLQASPWPAHHRPSHTGLQVTNPRHPTADARRGCIIVQVRQVWVHSGAPAVTAASFPAGSRCSAGGRQARRHQRRPGSL